MRIQKEVNSEFSFLNSFSGPIKSNSLQEKDKLRVTYKNKTTQGYRQSFSDIFHSWSKTELRAIVKEISKPREDPQKFFKKFRMLIRASKGKESACSAGDPVSIPGLGRCPGDRNGYPFQYSCLRIPWTAWRF